MWCADDQEECDDSILEYVRYRELDDESDNYCAKKFDHCEEDCIAEESFVYGAAFLFGAISAVYVSVFLPFSEWNCALYGGVVFCIASDVLLHPNEFSYYALSFSPYDNVMLH
jgi:hypothetical protein